MTISSRSNRSRSISPSPTPAGNTLLFYDIALPGEAGILHAVCEAVSVENNIEERTPLSICFHLLPLVISICGEIGQDAQRKMRRLVSERCRRRKSTSSSVDTWRTRRGGAEDFRRERYTANIPWLIVAVRFYSQPLSSRTRFHLCLQEVLAMIPTQET